MGVNIPENRSEASIFAEKLEEPKKHNYLKSKSMDEYRKLTVGVDYPSINDDVDEINTISSDK